MDLPGPMSRFLEPFCSRRRHGLRERLGDLQIVDEELLPGLGELPQQRPVAGRCLVARMLLPLRSSLPALFDVLSKGSTSIMVT